MVSRWAHKLVLRDLPQGLVVRDVLLLLLLMKEVAAKAKASLPQRTFYFNTVSYTEMKNILLLFFRFHFSRNLLRYLM